MSTLFRSTAPERAMVEVFKTDVGSESEAHRIVRALHAKFPAHQANFDLSDCDRVLRIVCPNGNTQTNAIVKFLDSVGVSASVLK